MGGTLLSNVFLFGARAFCDFDLFDSELGAYLGCLLNLVDIIWKLQ